MLSYEGYFKHKIKQDYCFKSKHYYGSYYYYFSFIFLTGTGQCLFEVVLIFNFQIK